MIKVFDVYRNEILTLVNEEKSERDYESEFDGTGLFSGFFYQLKARKYITVK